MRGKLPNLKITVTTGTGEGPTPLSAFDAALLDAGIASYNIIYLSSIIPIGSSIECNKFVAPPDESGHRLYVAIARHDEQSPTKTAIACLGWVQDSNDGSGLFVEMHGTKKEDIENLLYATFNTMMANRPSCTYGSVHHRMVKIECHSRPVCAIVAAVYKAEGWE